LVRVLLLLALIAWIGRWAMLEAASLIARRRR
jgi:uncharacterized paraquat-inducible protein A